MENMYFEQVVLQPTSLCNLNCSYCYLPDREKNLKMSIQVAAEIAKSIEKVSNHVSIIWHGGEPLSCGYEHFSELLNCFDDLQKSGKITHHIQTNATLINDKFCRLFIDKGIKIGVSIDGPEWINNLRVDWRGTSSYSRVINGIQFLKDYGINFNAIAVVTKETIGRARDMYEYFQSIGCESLGINIEEVEGVNIGRDKVEPGEVYRFWLELFQCWRNQPNLQIREFIQALSWARAIINDKITSLSSYNFDCFPSITWDGKVTLLSPELLSTTSKYYDNFISGNIMESSLFTIIEKSTNSRYIIDYKAGKEKCHTECSYYSFCQGGQASNKFFELGTINATKTNHCLNSKQMLIDAVLASI